MLSGSNPTAPLNFQQNNVLQALQSVQSEFGSDLGISALQAEIAQLQAEIDSMGGSTTAIQAEIVVLQGQMTTAQSGISTLQSDVSALQDEDVTMTDDIDQLQTDIMTAQTNITTLQSSQAAAAITISSIQSADTFMTGEISTIQGQITILQADDATLQTQQTSTSAAVTIIQGQVTTLQTDDVTMAAEIATLQTNAATDEAAIAALSTQLTSDVAVFTGYITSLVTNQYTDEAHIGTLQTDMTTAQADIVTLQGSVGGVPNLIQNVPTAPVVILKANVADLTLTLPTGILQTEIDSSGGNFLNMITDQALFQFIPAGASSSGNCFYVEGINFGNPNFFINNTTMQFQTVGGGVETLIYDGSGNMSHLCQGPATGFAFSSGTIGFTITPLFNMTPSLWLAQNTQKAQGFANTASSTIANDELITWGFLKSFIDTVLPLGVLMISSNGSPPSTFGGYITWAVYSTADAKYLKMTVTGATVGTSQAASLAQHHHGLGSSSIVTTAAGLHTHVFDANTPSFTGSTPTFTGGAATFTGGTSTFTGSASTFTGNVPTFTGTAGTTGNNSASAQFAATTGTYSALGATNAVSNVSSGTGIPVNGTHTHAFTPAGTINAVSGTVSTPAGTVSVCTGTVSTPTGTVSTVTGTVSNTGGSNETAGTHSHSIATGQFTDQFPTSSSTNEVTSTYVLIYVRTA